MDKKNIFGFYRSVGKAFVDAPMLARRTLIAKHLRGVRT